MRSALEAAEQGVGRTADNPSVGCTIVEDGIIIGQARTADGGKLHAEEGALLDAGDVRGATVYVTLEPCARRSSGRSPCADLLIEAGVGRVVIAASDPHPFASGAGVERLRAAGIVVEIGLMTDEARAQNPAFFARWDSR